MLSITFLLTGVGTALLGASLPAMLAEWHLSDRSGGWLLFSSFAGSSLGALLVQGGFRAFAATGIGISAAASFFVALSPRGPFHPAFLFYGLGLGAAMTAISLLRSQEAGPAESNLEMNRLNLLWAIGACCAPALALDSLHLISVQTLFRSEAAVLACTALLIVGLVGFAPVNHSLHTVAPAEPRPFAPPRMWLFAAAAVGLETAIGSWLTTYTQRIAHGTGIAVWANSVFWLGLLLSRGAHSVRSRVSLHSRAVVGIHLGAVTAAAILLVVAPSQASLPVAALLAGLGLGPLYPLVLSLSLPRFRSAAVFVMAGVGASVLPWLTGALSTTFGSLRAGLVAPCATVIVLLAAALWIWQEIPDRT